MDSTDWRTSFISLFRVPFIFGKILLLSFLTMGWRQGRIQDFKLRGAFKIFWVFRVKNHDFTQKSQIFFNFMGRGGGGGGAPPLKEAIEIPHILFKNSEDLRQR